MSNAVHGKLTDFRIDDSGGTLRDISNHVNKATLSRSAPEIDVTTFQDTARTYIPDFDGATLSVEGNCNATVMGYLHGILGLATTSTFNYGPEGTASGKRKMTGECVCIDVNEDGGVGKQNTFTAQFRISGAVTFTTY
jgi:hypothetical protein